MVGWTIFIILSVLGFVFLGLWTWGKWTIFKLRKSLLEVSNGKD